MIAPTGRKRTKKTHGLNADKMLPMRNLFHCNEPTMMGFAVGDRLPMQYLAHFFNAGLTVEVIGVSSGSTREGWRRETIHPFGLGWWGCGPVALLPTIRTLLRNVDCAGRAASTRHGQPRVFGH
jgi:hypothetical protein